MQKKGFTLIELLIVVAIIAILAAIAVPNFLEAQTRAKISRCKSDFRTLSVGLESYMVDSNRYPFPTVYTRDGMAAYFLPFIYDLSTPIAYLTTVDYQDPFASKNPWYHYSGWPLWSVAGKEKLPIAYINYNGFWAMNYQLDSRHEGYVLKGNGPDRWPQWAEWAWIEKEGQAPAKWNNGIFRSECWNMIYDSTNGTVSAGDIYRFGGDLPNAPPQ